MDVPNSEYAESAVLGAAILKAEDVKWLKRFTRRAKGRDFYSALHGWVWDRLKWYANHGRPPLLEWLRKDGVFEVYEETFKPRGYERLPVLMVKWVDTDFWWNAEYYLDVVLSLSRARRRLALAGAAYKEAIDGAGEIQAFTERTIPSP